MLVLGEHNFSLGYVVCLFIVFIYRNYGHKEIIVQIFLLFLFEEVKLLSNIDLLLCFIYVEL